MFSLFDDLDALLLLEDLNIWTYWGREKRGSLDGGTVCLRLLCVGVWRGGKENGYEERGNREETDIKLPPFHMFTSILIRDYNN